MILLYQLENAPTWPALQAAMAMHRFSFRHVKPEEYTLPLEQLADGVTLSTPALPGGGMEQPMMVFCNMKNTDVSNFLDLIRRLGVPPIALKAVMTPTTRSWTSLQLYQELKKEHDYFQNC